MALTFLQKITPIELWTATMREQAVKDVPSIIQEYNRLERSWQRARNMTEYNVGPSMTAAELSALRSAEQLMPVMKANLDVLINGLRAAAAEAKARGLLRPEQVQESGLSAIPLLLLGAAIAAVLVVVLVNNWYSTYRSSAPVAAVASGFTKILDGYAARVLAWIKAQPPGSEPKLPKDLKDILIEIGKPKQSTDWSSVAMLAVVGIALFTFGPSLARRRSA